MLSAMIAMEIFQIFSTKFFINGKVSQDLTQVITKRIWKFISEYFNKTNAFFMMRDQILNTFFKNMDNNLLSVFKSIRQC